MVNIADFYHYVEAYFHQCSVDRKFGEMAGYAMFIYDMVTKKRPVNFEDDDKM